MPLYEFGPYRLDTFQKLLFCDGKPVPLTAKALDVLQVLVEKRGSLVDKSELMQAVWPGTFVEEGNLSHHVYILRKALQDSSEQPKYIETVARRGYRFAAEVRETALEPRGRTGELHIEPARMDPPASTLAAAEPPLKHAGRVRPRGLWLALALALMVAGVIGAWRLSRTNASVSPLMIVPLTSYPGSVKMPAFSPDGEKIAFAWSGQSDDNWDIYVKLVGNDPPLRLTTNPGQDICPTWSPDGRQIAFLREREKSVEIWVVGALGGPERKLIDVAYGRYVDREWSPDGKRFVFAEKRDPSLRYDAFYSHALFAVSLETLEKKQLTFPTDGMSDHRFAFSPDARTLAFLRHKPRGADIMLMPAAGGEPSALYVSPIWSGHLAWSPDSHSLVFSSHIGGGNKLWRIAAAGGTPELLSLNEEYAYYPAVSRRGGRLAYVREYYDSDLWRIELLGPRGPGKPPVPMPGSARIDSDPEVSPDGRKLAFLSERSGRFEVWMSDADGSNPEKLTDFECAGTSAPTWSPDSKRLAFFCRSSIKGTEGIYILNVDNKEIRPFRERYAFPRWSRDGKWIFAFSEDGADVWRIPVDGGEPIPVPGVSSYMAHDSPDGKRLYYVRPFAAGLRSHALSGGEESVVLPEVTQQLIGHFRVFEDGIYFINPQTQPFATLEFFEFATRRRYHIARLNGQPTIYGGGITVSPDRKWVVYSQVSHSGSDIMLVENFH
jgi:Tol biopolymer transport system component/DNA-binding winged helix-turn-helix (wHTH) protein